MKDGLKLTPTGEKFPGLDSLRRSAMEGFGGSERDERMIAAAEGDMMPGTGDPAVGEGAGHPDTGGFERLRLSADLSVGFPGKQSLKRTVIVPGAGAPARKSAPRPVLIWTAGVAAAAAVAFALLVPVLRPAVDGGAALAAGSAPASAAAKPQAVAQQNQTRQNIRTLAPETAAQALRSGNTLAANDTQAPKTAGKAARSAGGPAPESTQTAPQTVTDIVASPFHENYGLAAGHDLLAQRTAIVIRVIDDEHSATAQPSGVQPGPAAELLRRLAGTAPPERGRAGLERMLSPIDRMVGGGVVAVNRLLGRETTVIKEYDKRGNLTHYAVYTPTAAMEKNYK